MKYEKKFYINGLIIGRNGKTTISVQLKTYSGCAYAISEKELLSAAENKENDRCWGDCWRSCRFSALEDHGIVTKYLYEAEGLDLESILKRAGLSEEEIHGNIQFAANHFKVVVNNPTGSRFYFGNDNKPASKAPALLALNNSRVTNGEQERITRRAPSSPRLLFGQQTPEEINKCSFVNQLRMIQCRNQKPAIKIYKNEALWCEPTLADILMFEQREITTEINGKTQRLLGTALSQLLERYELAGLIEYTFADNNGKKITVLNKDIDNYLLVWYSEDEQRLPFTNETDLKLLSPNTIYDNISSLKTELKTISGERQELPAKKPHQNQDNLEDSVFYCCVTVNGSAAYYYFNHKEILGTYTIQEDKFSYNDHAVNKTVHCRGVLLSDLIDSLCNAEGIPLHLPGGCQIQYLEEDAYHTDTPTYIDKLSEVRGICRPMLVFDKKESFPHPDNYHQDDETFKPLPLPFVYRAAVSANEAVVKGVMGISVQEKATKLAPDGYKLNLFSIKGEKHQLIAKKNIKGTVEGMNFCVRAPKLTRYEALYPKNITLIISGKPTIDFYYKELSVLQISYRGQTHNFYIGNNEERLKVIPESREYVEKLLADHDACLLNDDDTLIETPKRNLYIDGREIADNTAPFGYDNLLLRRYEGFSLNDIKNFLCAEAKTADVYNANGEIISLLANNEDNFLAFRHTESKGVPYNTAIFKRVVKEYPLFKLISSYDGAILSEDITKIALR